MILGVVPARGGSKGLPGKNVRLLAGEPLIVHTIRAARASGRLDALTVSTDDPVIADVARRAGVDVPNLRPWALATDGVALWPAIRHAVSDWEARCGRTAHVVVVLQPTSPLRTGADIDSCVQVLEDHGADMCVSVCRPHDSPYFNLVEPNGSRFVRPCSPLMARGGRRQDAPPVYALNGAVYAMQRVVLDRLDNQFALERLAVSEMPPERSVDIDTLDDLALAEWRLSRHS